MLDSTVFFKRSLFNQAKTKTNNKMRKTSEILQTLLTMVDCLNTQAGLCGLATYTYDCDVINDSEYKVLCNYLKNNRPADTIFNPWMLFNRDPRYWYIPGFIYPRKRWLKKHIALCQSKGD